MGLHKDLSNITGNSFCRCNAVTWTAGFHQGLKASIINNLEWPFTFCNPANNLCAAMLLVVSTTGNKVAHRASVVVCWVCLYVTFPFATRSKASVIDEFVDCIFPKASRATWTFLVSSAAATASSPQQIFACLQRLPVDLASPVS